MAVFFFFRKVSGWGVPSWHSHLLETIGVSQPLAVQQTSLTRDYNTIIHQLATAQTKSINKMFNLTLLGISMHILHFKSMRRTATLYDIYI